MRNPDLHHKGHHLPALNKVVPIPDICSFNNELVSTHFHFMNMSNCAVNTFLAMIKAYCDDLYR